jgi:hypothetical protein
MKYWEKVIMKYNAEKMFINHYHMNIGFQGGERIYPFFWLLILASFEVSCPKRIWILLWFMQTIHLHSAKLMWIYSICYSWWWVSLKFLCLLYCDCSFTLPSFTRTLISRSFFPSSFWELFRKANPFSTK